MTASRSIGLLLFSLLLLLFFSSTGLAQNASLTGTVHDAQGAVIPGAQVSLTNEATGVVLKATSNGQGDYLISGLGAGSYDLEVEAPGFEQYKAVGVVLRVDQNARVNATLQIGQVSSTVTVQGGDVAQVETQTSSLSEVVTGKQISQIVLNGRNFTQLVSLVPGVSNQTGQDEGTVGIAGNVQFSVNGGREEYNNWELDGGDNMDNGSNATLNVYPSVDAIAEVRVLTSTYGAQYGRNGSGTVETVTKSGTKDFHGDLYEFVRNDDFNARNFFQTTVPEYKKNDFGYTIGGPVFIPNHYNRDRNKTFFFFSEEWRKEIVPAATYDVQVPSTQERQGNFSDVCPAAGSAVNSAYPDCPVNPATGAYFPNNTVPIDPNAQALLGTIPQANVGSGTGSYFEAAPAQPTNWREELFRIDENVNDRVRLFVRYAHDSWNTVLPYPEWGQYGSTASFPTIGTNFNGPAESAVANLAWTISPSLLNEFTASYTTDHIFFTTIGPAERPSTMTMTGLYNNGFGGLLPSFSVAAGQTYDSSGLSVDTGYFPWNNANPTYTYKDQLSQIIGSHNLYYGAYFVAAEKNEFNSPYIQGTLTFDNTDAAVTTGNAFADLLMGNIASYTQTNAKIKYYNRYKILEPYLQDDWHVNKRLTLNLGVRISLFGTYHEKYHQAYNFETAAYNAAQAPQIDSTGGVTGQEGALIPGTGNPYTGLVQCGVNGVPAGCMTGHLFNPAPRVGFAYDLTGDGKTSLRAAYGMFYEHTNGNEGNTESLEGSPPLVQTATQYNIMGYSNIGGSGLQFPLSPIAIPTKAIWPYMQQWNINIQRELAPSTVMTVAYVGSKGTHLTDERDINQLYPISQAQNPFAPGQPITANDCANQAAGGGPSGQAGIQLSVACGGDPNPYRPYPGYGTITLIEPEASSSYNALQVSAHRHAGGLSINLAYTWSHSIDDSSDRYDTNFLDSYNLALSRSSSNFDQRQILNIGYVYDLPFFRNHGFLHTALGGWEWSGLVTYQSGTPFSVVDGLYTAGVGNGAGTGAFLDMVGNPYTNIPATPNVPGVQGPLLYNPAAFVAPQGLTFGTAQRNVLNLPGRTNFDMGLFKHFAITESRSFEFRAEGFNVFNHTQFSAVNNTASCFGGTNYSAGDVSCLADNNFLRPNAAHNPRILQLGLKFLF